MTIAVECLAKDGYLSANSKMVGRGNFYQALIDYPYMPKSATAMGTNTVKAMQFLKIVVPNDDGELVPNANSRHLQTLKSKLLIK